MVAGKRYSVFTDLIPARAALIHLSSGLSKGALGDRPTRGVPSGISSTWVEPCKGYREPSGDARPLKRTLFLG